jgi:hypothetical protein
MLKAVLSLEAGSRQVLVLGLERANTDRMHAGDPIRVVSDDVDPRLPHLEVVIMAGEDNDAMVAELRRYFPMPDDPITDPGPGGT